MSRITKQPVKGPVPRWEELRPEVNEGLLADITHRIVEAFQPHKVILFGSYAYGQPRPDSDVDLLVIMDSDEPMIERMLRVSEVARVRFLPMDVLVRTPEEIEYRLSIGDFFLKEIVEKGRVLYECTDS
jgi:predicted nucleotidyltransferase